MVGCDVERNLKAHFEFFCQHHVEDLLGHSEEETVNNGYSSFLLVLFFFFFGPVSVN